MLESLLKGEEERSMSRLRADEGFLPLLLAEGHAKARLRKVRAWGVQ